MRSASCGRKASFPGFVQWPAAIAASALFALVVGALSLRTRGVYFIMITLAFAQMIYYAALGMDRYGGDDGLTIRQRSQFGGLIDLNNKTLFYYLCFALLLGQHLSGLAHRQFALRPGHPGRALQRAAHARDRISGFPLQAGLLRHRRRDVRTCRRAARQSHQLRQPGDDVLDPLRRSHGHGGAGRPRHAVRPADRRRRHSCCWRKRCRASPNIPGCSSARRCSWSRSTCAAASTDCSARGARHELSRCCRSTA